MAVLFAHPSHLVVVAMPGRRSRRDMNLWSALCLLVSLQLCLNVDLNYAQQFDEKEYCEAEVFSPKCQPDEVVVITSARYGRMRVGKCVRTDYGYVGCFAPVRPHLDSKCSGRRTCNLRIPDTELDDTKPCPTEFKTYLEASYTCIRVESAECRMCQTTTHAAVTLDKGYLASVVSEESQTGCGTARCPWRIELPPGQRVNLTLFDFGIAASKKLRGYVESCFRYAIIKEKGSADKPICSSSKREDHAYLSKTNIVEIHIVSPEVFGQRGQFMLYYEAVGCPRLDAPKNSWAKQEGNVFTYGCLGSSDSWSMRCKGTVWEGQMRACEEAVISSGPATLTLSLGVLIAIIVAIALVIGVLILTVGLVCLKRQQHNNFRRQDQSVYLRTRRESDYPEDIPSATLPLQYTKKEEIPEEDIYKSRSAQPNIRENVYMESRPLPQIPSLPGEAEDDARSERSSKVQVYRTSSGREHYHNPRLVITPRPTPPHSAEPREDPQYFVLDPDELTCTPDPRDLAIAAAAVANAGHQRPDTFGGGAGCSSAMPPPPLRRIARGGVQSDKQKSPEEENAENFCKEVSNTSCNDLPALQHYEASVDCHNHNGNSSWP